jgi:hypothetical protein
MGKENSVGSDASVGAKDTNGLGADAGADASVGEPDASVGADVEPDAADARADASDGPNPLKKQGAAAADATDAKIPTQTGGHAGPDPDAGISFMTTSAMKEQLRARGFSDEEIRHIRPQDAGEILADPARRAAQPPPTCWYCGRPGGNEVSLGGEAPIRLHPDCERAFLGAFDA